MQKPISKDLEPEPEPETFQEQVTDEEETEEMQKPVSDDLEPEPEPETFQEQVTDEEETEEILKPVSDGLEPELEPETPQGQDLASPKITEAGTEDYFFDIHAPVQSEEEIFGKTEPEPDPLFEVTADREISSFDLYADEQNSGSPPEKKHR